MTRQTQTEVKQFDWHKEKWPDPICVECKHYLDENQCKHCIRWNGRKDKWEDWQS